MSYTITCPYCFEKFEDYEVHFRSEKVNQEKDNPIPAEYDDVEDFKAKYRGEDKEEILKKYAEWEFFMPQKDPVYEAFWEKFGGTTEAAPGAENKDDERAENKVKPYERKIINPMNSYHKSFLKKPNDGKDVVHEVLLKRDGIVKMIVLKDDTECMDRVCPKCHNPLPPGYGRYTTKFITLVGITNSGKTVYLQQLLNKMSTYLDKAGLPSDDDFIVPSVYEFTKKNAISINHPLPASTPAESLQQPLYYQVIRQINKLEREIETFVLYDVAGENFKRGTDESHINNYVPFLQHSDGIIMLIDPLQFDVFHGLTDGEDRLQEMRAVINIIDRTLCSKDTGRLCEIPFAVCISKADIEPVQKVFKDMGDLGKRLLNDVTGEKNASGVPSPIFNAKEHNPIAMGLNQFFRTYEEGFVGRLHTTFTQYSYFAFTALGCAVKEKEEVNGMRLSYPEGPILPKRIEEPLFWLLHKFGYLRTNEPIFNPEDLYVRCPKPGCGSDDVEEFPERKMIVSGWGPFKKTEYFDYKCNKCGHEWEKEKQDSGDE